MDAANEVNCLFFDFLAKNETLALPAKSKTPEVEKISARSTTGNEIAMLLTLRKEKNAFFQILICSLFFSKEPVGNSF